MASFRFIGDPQHDGQGPDDITLLGHRFDRRHATEVSDAGVIAKLAGNSHFIEVDAAATPVPEGHAPVALPQRPSRKRKLRQGSNP
jgi:hypothetical protein